MSGIEHASSQSIKPFRSSEEYLYAMKEDLAEWLKDLYRIDVDVNNLLEVLENGAWLCAYANNVTRVADEFSHKHGHAHLQLPASGVTFVSSAQPETFLARDNVSNFINWCRNQMNVKDVLMFETDDLVLRKNEKNFVLCLLEVARRASRFGMAAPVLIQLEQEIEEEIREELELPGQETTQPAAQRCLQNIQDLDEMVQCLISRCTCPTQFPMVKISDGKYKVGDSNTVIFVRILRNHVMVRVGGGWDTLEHYLDKHDPCRCTSLTHKLAQRPATPVHEIKARPCGPHGQTGSQTTLMLSRAQSPLEPVLWSPSATSRTHRASPQPRLSHSPDPSLRNCPSPKKLKERAVIGSCRQASTKSMDDSVLRSTSRTGREATRTSPTPRLTSSLPRPSRPSTPSQLETQRPSTPLIFQKVQSQISVQQQQQGPENRLGQTWTKSHFVSKLRQSATAGAKNNQEMQNAPEKPSGSVSTRPFQCITPVLNLNTNKNSLVTHQPPIINIQESDDSARKSPDFIRTFCPSKGLMNVVSGKAHMRCITPTEKPTLNSLSNDGNDRNQQKYSSHGDRKQYLELPVHTERSSPINMSKSNGKISSFQLLKSGEQEMEDRYLFTPPPISPAQEAVLYQSLEEEILSNLQELGLDSDSSDSEKEQYSSRPETPLNSLEISYEIQKPYAPDDSKPNDTKETQFQAVIGELSNGRRLLERVSLDSWVNTLSRGSRGRKQETHADAESSLLNVFKPSVASSWSSLGSSLDSKDFIEPSRTSDAKRVETNSTSNSKTYKQEHPLASSFRQKRSLKKPERVPSIYKLKLRPCIHPRRDHRPDKKPSKIPKPVSYKESQCPGDANHTKMPVDTTATCQKGLHTPHRASSMRHPRKNSHTTSKFSPTPTVCAIKCQEKDQETMTDHEIETWV